ncbi:MAG: hypothetical protein IJY92_00075 [Alphaproteobacteria bacterium]|nr:hypothetical protein [Alphaproteobacteria bacterium]
MDNNIFYISNHMDTTLQKKGIDTYVQRKGIKGKFVDESEFSLLKGHPNKGRTIFVSNLLSIDSSLEGIKQTLSELTSAGIKIVSIEDNLEFSDNKTTSAIFKGMEIAIQIKSACNSLVMKNKLAQKKKEGGIIGRHKGAKNLAPSKCEINKRYIFQAIKNGETKTAIAKEIGVSVRTLFNFLKLNKNKG